MNDVLQGLALNPALPSGLLARLLEAPDDELADELGHRRDLSRAQLRALTARFEGAAVQLARSGRLAPPDVDPEAQPSAALALLDKGAGPPEWARLLARAPDARLRETLAGCPDLPEDVALGLAADPELRVVVELALWAAPDVAARLARHPHAEVRRAVAVNTATPPDLLAALLTGEGSPPATSCLVCDQETPPFVHPPDCTRPDCTLVGHASCDGSHESTVHATQQSALGNPSTPAEAAAGFADHPSPLLRQELAARTDLPQHVYARLAEDPVPWVRAQLADNPAVGERLIRVLAEDRGHDVQRRLAHHPSLPLDVLPHLSAATRIGPTLLPRVASASPAETAELAASPSARVRMLLAERRDLPDRIRDALASDADAAVVKSVAPHPGLTEAQLAAMVERHGTSVAARVAANPAAAPALLERLALHRPPARKALREIATHPNATAPSLLACLADPRARRLAAGHPGLPPEVVVTLLADEDWQVARAAAANPALPPEAMTAAIDAAWGAPVDAGTGRE
jgi:hypothetical protein